MSDAVNLRILLNGQQERLAGAEYAIARLERKLIEQRLEKEAAESSIRQISELLEEAE